MTGQQGEQGKMDKWYAYRHFTGAIVVHPYRRPLDITSARSSPYVFGVTEPFDASNREEAEAKAEQLLRGERNDD